MFSRLKETVDAIASKKGIKMTSFQEARIRGIERKLDKGDISIEEAIEMLESEIRYHFEQSDYREIKKKLESR